MVRFSGRKMFIIYNQNNSIKKIIVSLHFRNGLAITEIAFKQMVLRNIGLLSRFDLGFIREMKNDIYK